MSVSLNTQEIRRRLAEAEATIEALLSGQIDAVVASTGKAPVLLSKAQEALSESETRYRSIVETTSEGILTLDSESKITFVNRRLAEMLGYSVDAMVGKSLFEFVPPVARARATWRVSRAQQGVSEESEVAITRRDGSELWVLLKSTAILDANGKYIGTLAMMTDRTKHRQSELALRKSEEQYRQIVETTTDGILMLDDAARIMFVNRRFAEMVGYQPSEMVETSVFDYMSAAAKVDAVRSIQDRKMGGTEEVDTSFRHRDGTEIEVNIAGRPLIDGEGHHVSTLAVIRDVTEQKKLQSQLMVSDRMASVGTLAAGVAHEINNPLAAMISNLDYISESLGRRVGVDTTAMSPSQRDAWFQDEIKSPLDDAREAAQRVRSIVRDLKIFSRSPTEEPSVSVDVNATMESSLRMGWNEIRHRAQLVKQFGRLPNVGVNEARLGQVFLNLIVNAAQAIPEGRAEHNEIRVITRVDEGRVIVEVSDTGAGIAPEHLNRIFDAFFTTKAVGVGTGLGLAICQRIITDMGGELTVESEVGKGTTFRVVLPISRDESGEIAKVVTPSVSVGRRGRILMVDDEPLVVRGMKRILSKEHDVTAILAATEALALCTAGEKFDLILCDLMMPDMTGMDLHRALMQVAPDQADRMIFLTGGAFTPDARQFLDAPRVHLEKPFDPSNLRAIVQCHLRGLDDRT